MKRYNQHQNILEKQKEGHKVVKKSESKGFFKKLFHFAHSKTIEEQLEDSLKSFNKALHLNSHLQVNVHI